MPYVPNYKILLGDDGSGWDDPRAEVVREAVREYQMAEEKLQNQRRAERRMASPTIIALPAATITSERTKASISCFVH